MDTHVPMEIEGDAKQPRAVAGNGEAPIVAMLRRDHEEVARLFARALDDAGGESTRREALGALMRELIAHGRAEEIHLYSEMPRDAARRGIHEHRQTGRLLERIAIIPVDSEEWKPTVERLRAHVEHHVRWEEEVVFPEVNERFSDQGARDLARRFADRRDQEKRALQS